MSPWLIILIITLSVLFLTLVTSLICYCFVFLRGAEIDFNRPIEFKLSEYRNDKERMKKAFEWFDNQPFENLEMKVGKLKLHALYLKTEEASRTAIFFHGYRGSARNEFSPMIPFYQKLGYNICLVSQRAHGKSRGKLITFGIREKKDCLKWVNFINKKFKPQEILLVGVSMGASTVLMASSKIQSNVKYVIADCGYACPDEQVKYLINVLHLPLYPTIWFVKFWLFVFTGIRFSNYKIPEMLKKTEVPILFIHGKKDKMVPYYNTLMNYDEKKDRKEILLINDAPHAGSYIYATSEYEQKVKEFLEKYKK